MFNNSNFMAVKKRLKCEWGGVNPPTPSLANSLLNTAIYDDDCSVSDLSTNTCSFNI